MIEALKRAIIVVTIMFLVVAVYHNLIAPLIENTTADPNQQIEEYIEKYGNPFPCTEDMPCWDCETMGNKQCGTAT